MNWLEYMVSITEILGTVAFSISGAMTAIRKKMDILGVVVLGVVTAVGGGVIRDLLLGITPPAAFQNPVYVAWASGTALLAFVLARHTWSEKDRYWFEMFLNLVDSLGLGLFAVIGVETAVECGYGENGFLSIFVGVLTGVGGGMLRDTMAGEVPKIFRKRIYALAAMAGAMVYYYTADRLIGAAGALWLAAALVVAIRILAAHFEWDLPRVK